MVKKIIENSDTRLKTSNGTATTEEDFFVVFRYVNGKILMKIRVLSQYLID